MCGVALSAALAASAKATDYNEAILGDFSNAPGAPTNIGALTLGNNNIIGSSIPHGPVVPGGHGALAYPDYDFFTFTVPTGDVLSSFKLLSNSTIVDGDRFFLGIYSGATAPVDPSNPTPAGLLGYTLPGTPQIGKNLLPDLSASSEFGFPPLATHFSIPLAAGQYTVWLEDADNPVHYDLNLGVSSAPEPAAWVLMIAGVGLMGAGLRRRPGRGDLGRGLVRGG